MSLVTTKHFPMNGREITSRGFLAQDINDLVYTCHNDQVDAGWWHDSITGAPLQRNFGELIALIHSELSEALEGDRKDLMDDKLPQYKMADVEMADVLIRLCDLAGARGVNLGEITVAKLAYNRQRADHKPANRALEGGKKY
jgi:hypothetical protein